jgi:hypothetical protein
MTREQAERIIECISEAVGSGIAVAEDIALCEHEPWRWGYERYHPDAETAVYAAHHAREAMRLLGLPVDDSASLQAEAPPPAPFEAMPAIPPIEVYGDRPDVRVGDFVTYQERWQIATKASADQINLRTTRESDVPVLIERNGVTLWRRGSRTP